MNKCQTCANMLLICVFFIFNSCQNDTYLEPKLTSKNYSYKIPNKISFNFSQQSNYSNSIIPYSNKLSLKNIGDTPISGEFIVLAFKSNDKDYNNLSFIKKGDVLNLSINKSQDDITLELTNVLFTDENVIASILNFNDAISDHTLNGYYSGELNIYTIDEVFLKSITCTGFIDYQGKFAFFIENSDEDNIVALHGNLNTKNLISGKIMKRDGTSLSQITNIDNEYLELDQSNLSGKVTITENSEERILQFNLTHQN